MSTNLQNLPQIPAGSLFTIEWGADWNDQLFVPIPGFYQTTILAGVLAVNSNIVNGIASTAGLFSGMPAAALGVPGGAVIDGVYLNSVTLSQPSLISGPTSLTFFPPPLDLTGISFTSNLRLNANSPAVILKMTTANGQMTNGGVNGQFGFNVSAAALRAAPFPGALQLLGSLPCVLDIVATDATGATVNLCAASGPIPVTVNLPVTR